MVWTKVRLSAERPVRLQTMWRDLFLLSLGLLIGCLFATNGALFHNTEWKALGVLFLLIGTRVCILCANLMLKKLP